MNELIEDDPQFVYVIRSINHFLPAQISLLCCHGYHSALTGSDGELWD